MKRIITIMVFLVAGLVVATGFDMNSAQGPGGEGVSGDAGTNAGIDQGCKCKDAELMLEVEEAAVGVNCELAGKVTWRMPTGSGCYSNHVYVEPAGLAEVLPDHWWGKPCSNGMQRIVIKAGGEIGCGILKVDLYLNGEPCKHVQQPLSVVKVDIEVNNTPETADDVVALYSDDPPLRPTVHCRARVQGLCSGSVPTVLTGTGDRIRFSGVADLTRTLSLPADGGWVGFDVSGQKVSGSINDTQIQAHLYDKNHCVCGSQRLTVLKVEINRVISDQLPNRECNVLPGQNLMYMGTRADDRAYLQVEANVLPQQINNIGLVGVRHGTTVLDSGPIQQPKTPLDFAPAGSRQQYEIVGGIDQNSDGQLQNAEICTNFSPHVLVLTQSDYNYSRGVLDNYAIITWGVGSQLLEAFIDDVVPPNVANTQTTITSGELTHPLGANWDANCSATTRRYTYVEGTETSDDVEEDDHTVAALKASLNQHKTEVQNYFTQNPNVTEHTFGPWNWQAPNLQFDGLALHFAFGHVTISGTVSVTVRRSDLEVTHIVYGGSFDDIYDFDYNGAYPSQHGATVQAGFPTLGVGGRVFRDRVEFSRDTTNFDYDFN